MEPWQSWTAAVVLGAGAYLYYRQPLATNARAGKAQKTEPSKANSKGRNNEKSSKDVEPERSPAPSKDSKASKKRKPRKETPVDSSGPEEPLAAPEKKAFELDAEDADWAKQLDAAKRGVNMKPSASSGKNVAAGSSLRQEPGIPDDSSATVTSGNDVSDMLQAPAAGPSVVRVTGEEKAKEAKPRKASPARETKKQRQNKKKAEEKKAMQEEQEKERQKQLENQRRSAREARGEPAKNGLAPSKAQPNAWAQPVSNGETDGLPNGQATKASAPLLDTFDQDAPSTSSSEQPAQPPANGRKIPNLQQDLPSEEEQMEAIQQMNGWNEVTKKGKKKNSAAPSTPPVEPGTKENTKQNDYATTSTHDLVSGHVQGPSPAYVPSKAKASQQNPTNKDAKSSSSNAYAALEAATSFAAGEKAHPADSDWAVE
ncbi:MAG: hypothetical protein M1831_005840 [Alyxoria varia]|nr:MAG: hypothetical protein M1831_005840 [Alyxoria varia]